MEPMSNFELFSIIKSIPENLYVSDDLKIPSESISRIAADYQKQAEGYKKLRNDYKEFQSKYHLDLNSATVEETNTAKNDSLISRQKELSSKFITMCKTMEEKENQTKTLKAELTSDYEKLSNELKLYTAASGIFWKTDAPSHLVSGYAMTPRGPKFFEFDKRATSQFQICNELWKLSDCT